MDNQLSPTDAGHSHVPLSALGAEKIPAVSAAQIPTSRTPPSEKGPERSDSHPVENNLTVLLVDDDYDVHITFDQVLTSSGYRVEHAVSEIDAIQLLKETLPDFLLTNWKESVPSNVPFFESLRRAYVDKYLYIIVMTAEGMANHKTQVLASGANAFVVKPVKPGELLSLLQAGTRMIEKHLHDKNGQRTIP